MQTLPQYYGKIFVEPEKHVHAVHTSKVTRATAVLAFSVMSASHKDLASGGECGVELRSYDGRHDARHGLPHGQLFRVCTGRDRL